MADRRCPKCGEILTQEMIDVNMCWECGYIIDDELVDDKIIVEDQREEIKKVDYALSFDELYEYDVETIINENHGRIDSKKMIALLNLRAKEGWKLHTIYSNELGKKALSVMGFGINATACEDVLVFERRIKKEVRG